MTEPPRAGPGLRSAVTPTGGGIWDSGPHSDRAGEMRSGGSLRQQENHFVTASTKGHGAYSDFLKIELSVCRRLQPWI